MTKNPKSPVGESLQDKLKQDPELKNQLEREFAASGPFGEIIFRELMKNIENSQPIETVEEAETLTKEIREAIFTQHLAFKQRVESYLEEDVPFGDALRKAWEDDPPTNPDEEEVLEISSKWIAWGKVFEALLINFSLTQIAEEWKVSFEWVKEVYDGFLTFIVKRVLGGKAYLELTRAQQEHLKSLLVMEIVKEISPEEFEVQAKAIALGIITDLRIYSVSELLNLPKDQVKQIMRLLMEAVEERDVLEWAEARGLPQENFETLSEEYLIDWARDKGIKQKDFQALLGLLEVRRHTVQ